MGEVEVHALRHVTLAFEESHFTVLLGPSGSGKSTLLNIDAPVGLRTVFAPCASLARRRSGTSAAASSRPCSRAPFVRPPPTLVSGKGRFVTLSPGTRLGPYEIPAAIGACGIGEVYRATDTALGRQVAIKVLPEAFAHDAERLARFEREARTLAVLNHPNIAQPRLVLDLNAEVNVESGGNFTVSADG
jgi:hypothetical protein